MSPSSLKLSGNDGIHKSVDFIVKILVDHQDSVALDTSVELFLAPEHFYMVGLVLDRFAESQMLEMSKVLGYNRKRSSVFVNTPYANDISNRLNTMQEQLKTGWKKLGISLRKVETNPCSYDPCLNGGTCQTQVKIETPYSTFDTNSSNSWVIPSVSRTYHCNCPEDYSGQNCELLIRRCDLNPCENGGNCTTKNGQVVCDCLPGFLGKRCEEDADECAAGNPCQNGGYCENIAGGYRCICLMGFSGKHCDLKVNECSAKPCQNGGTCERNAGEYVCRCTFGFSGAHCEHSSLGFESDSYLKLPALDPTSNELTMEFATVEPNALFLFSYDERASVSKDFIAVDIVDGHLRLSGRLADKDLMSVVLNTRVNDGLWHKFTLKHEREVVVMSVSECRANEKLCRQCIWGDESCHASLNTGIATLPVAGHSAFL